MYNTGKYYCKAEPTYIIRFALTIVSRRHGKVGVVEMRNVHIYLFNFVKVMHKPSGFTISVSNECFSASTSIDCSIKLKV